MLKSTYKPSANASPPLLPGWTEHKAPTGHTYYHNASTKESTYTRPSAPIPAAPPPTLAFAPAGAAGNIALTAPPMAMGNLANPRAANAFMQTYNPAFQAHAAAEAAQREAQRIERQNRPKPQPIDKPKRRVPIPGCEPWILVYTKYGRRFVYNPLKNASYWRIPEKIMKGVLELDVKGVRQKAGDMGLDDSKDGKESKEEAKKEQPQQEEAEDSSEYEEIEVTGSEGEDDDGHPSKRQRTEEAAGPIEFSEADIAAQLAAMQEEYGGMDDEDGEYQNEQYPEAEGEYGGEEEGEEPPLSEEDSQQLFHDLLDDRGINPYSSWDKILEEGKLLDDWRYVCLPTTKARHESFSAWSRLRIQALKETRAKEPTKDPRLPYLEFLAEKATPKLYWPEFKRKFRKEEAMRDSRLAEREKEKLFREYVARLKLPTSTLQKDLATLLKSQPVKVLNNQTSPADLPSAVLADLRYVSVDPKIREPLVEAFISSLPPPPDASTVAGGNEEEDEEKMKKRRERERRGQALRQREEALEEKRRREQRRLDRERALLREENREIEAAMYVDRSGLLSQLREDAKKEG